MCGIVGISASSQVSPDLYEALLMLQHRGQDSSGMVTELDGKIYQRRGHGLVDHVFRKADHLEELRGFRGIGHVRYPTAGGLRQSEVQPFVVGSPYGIALAHNGNLTNTDFLQRHLREEGIHNIASDTDSELLLNVFANALRNNGGDANNLTPERIFDAVDTVQKLCEGSFSVIVVIVGHGILAFRDRFGIRPLVYATREGANGLDYIFASESIACTPIGYSDCGDIDAGEAVFVDNDHTIHRHRTPGGSLTPCLFEYVYLSRPDSVINGVSVYSARRNMGISLGKKILREWPDHDIDIVVGVPDTSRIAASEVAGVLDVPYREALIKNRYIGRTFIMPNQKERQKSIKRKLNPIPVEFAGSNVLLVDDSIVRGNTSKQIVKMVRDAGAKSVYFASASPPVCFQNVYGIDMPSKLELLTGNHSVEDARTFIGCDRLFYQSLADLKASVIQENRAIHDLESSVFNGCYISGTIDEQLLNKLENARNDSCKEMMANETLS